MKNYYKLTSLAVAAGLAFATTSVTAQVFVDFDLATDVNDFTPHQTAILQHDASAGIGGTGGLDFPSGTTDFNGAVWAYNQNSYDVASLTSLTIQLDALRGADNDVDGGDIHNRVGLLPDTGDNFSTGFFVSYEDANRLVLPNTVVTDGATVSIAQGNWSRLVLNISDNGTAYDLTAELYDLGASGTDTPTLVLSGTDTVSTLYGDTSVWGGFKVNQGATELDNFEITAVPEPSAFGLLAGIFGFAWVMLRRR